MKSLKSRRPDLLLDQARQDLDRHVDDLQEALRQSLQDKQLQLQRLSDFLARATPLQMMKPFREQLKGLEAQLQAYHPHGPLKRGYAIVTLKESGSILRDSAQVKKGDRLTIQVKKGTVESEVTSKQE